jgi:RNA polymerase sigma-70 factor, ECF subfamily
MGCEAGVRRVHGARRGDADTDLVRAAQAGDSEAYGELVGRYQDCIYTIVSDRVADREDALDLVQETFFRAYRALGGFRQEAGFYTWLYRIAVRLCIDHSRKRKRRQEPVSLDQYLLQDPIAEPAATSPACDPERSTINLHLRAALSTALQQLSEPYRAAVILHDVEGLSQEKIARIMDCPIGTAKSRIQRGRYQLRDLLRPFVRPDA